MQERNSPARSGENPSTSYGDQDMESDRSIQERAGGVAEKAQEKASEYGSKLQEQADVNIDRAAEGLEKAAEQMRSRLEDKGGVQEKVGIRVADGLDRTSTYLRDHEAQEIWSDVEAFVKEHPIQAAATAALAGFVLARMMK